MTADEKAAGSSRSYSRFVLVIGVGAAVAAVIILAILFVIEPEGELAFEGLIPATIIVQPLSPSAGSPALVRGSGFSQGDEVMISFNGEEVGETIPQIVIVNDFGEFNAEILIPPEVGRVENDITATDESGNSAMTRIRLTEEENRGAGATGLPHVS